MATIQHSIAILDDYQNLSATADWSQLPNVPRKVFNSPIPPNDLISTLAPFTLIHAMRERTKFPRSVLEQLPNLKFISTTGLRNRGIDVAAATELGIVVSGTVSGSNKSEGTVEQTWALILALSRRLILEHDGVRNGAWQTGVATGLSGKQLGLVGVGRLGQAVARIGVAFGLDVVGWSPNLTEERAREAGVELAPSLDYLLSSSDIVSIHIVEAPSTIGLIGASQLALLKPAAFLVNTSRGPIVDEEALIDALEKRSFGGAGLDVFAQEPLPLNHRLRQLDNVVLSPHMGYVDEASYGPWWEQTPKNFAAFLAGEPLRVLSG